MATTKNGLPVEPFGPRDVAGEQTVNPIVEWIRQFNVMSEFLQTSVMGNGSISLDLDFPLLAAKILSMVQKTYGEFKGTVSGGRITVAAGHVLVNDHTYPVGQHTETANDNVVIYFTLNKQGGVSWGSGGYPSDGCVSGGSIVVPVCQPYKSGRTWRVRQLQHGTVIIPFPPAEWIDGYDATKTQSLDHSGGTLVWHTYKTCNK